jgi:hypothetical protein
MDLKVDEAPAWARTQTATFQPQRLGTLRPESEQFIGQTFEWRGLWVVTEEVGGDYVGQTVWEPADRDVWFGWVPDEDLIPTAQPTA